MRSILSYRFIFDLSSIVVYTKEAFRRQPLAVSKECLAK